MPKLNDTQMILLSTASQRDDRSLYPLSDTIAGGTRVSKAISVLVEKALAKERETSDVAATHRIDGDIRYGVFATDTGLAAIGIGESENAAAKRAAKRPRQTKNAAVISLLERDDGATLAELIAATGWLPHTTRAALTGLRKKGQAVERTKRGDETCYRIAKAG